jgi:hypothetical protein
MDGSASRKLINTNPLKKRPRATSPESVERVVRGLQDVLAASRAPPSERTAGCLWLAARQCASVIQGFLMVGGFPGTRYARRKRPGGCSSVAAVRGPFLPIAITAPRIGNACADPLSAKRRRVRHRSYYTLRTVVTKGEGCYTILCREGLARSALVLGRHPRRRATPPAYQLHQHWCLHVMIVIRTYDMLHVTSRCGSKLLSRPVP